MKKGNTRLESRLDGNNERPNIVDRLYSVVREKAVILTVLNNQSEEINLRNILSPGIPDPLLRPSVRTSVHPSVRPCVRPSVRPAT